MLVGEAEYEDINPRVVHMDEDKEGIANLGKKAGHSSFSGSRPSHVTQLLTPLLHKLQHGNSSLGRATPDCEGGRCETLLLNISD